LGAEVGNGLKVRNQAHERTPEIMLPLYSHFSLFDKSALPWRGA